VDDARALVHAIAGFHQRSLSLYMNRGRVPPSGGGAVGK
jgi:hypothetical protein